MLDLRVLRENWESHDDEEEMRLLRAKSPQQTLKEWAELQRAFEWHLQQTASLFEQERQDALAELQARLRRLND